MIGLILVVLFFIFFNQITDFLLGIGTLILVITAYIVITMMIPEISLGWTILLILVMIIGLISIPYKIFYNFISNIFKR